MNANLYNIADERERRDPEFYVKFLAAHKGHNDRREAKRNAYYRRKFLSSLVRDVLAAIGFCTLLSFAAVQLAAIF